MPAKKKSAASRTPKKAAVVKPVAKDDALFDRVAAILEQARGNVVRAVNSNMVLAYWLIGREIVQEIQGGGKRAGYGKQVLESLSNKMTARYGRGFSTTNLRYFRSFFSTYPDRIPEIRQIGSGELEAADKEATDADVLNDLSRSVETAGQVRGFSPALGWSHYQALLGVEHSNERLFYEIEAEKEGWDVKHLKRQIHTFLFARLLKSRNKAGVMELTRQGLTLEKPADTLKNPYILDFLGMPDSEKFHESELEAAIIDNLQQFLLELGKGFAFVGRQQRRKLMPAFFISTWFSTTTFSSAFC